MTDTRIRLAVPEDAAAIAAMAVALTEEISQRLGVKTFNLDPQKTASLCHALLREEKYLALIAIAEGEAIGFVGISEGRALYAEGALATMQEFFVAPPFRSNGVGGLLLNAAAELARKRRWNRLEVCTPPLPEYDRSLAFYERHGFEITGGRKLKRLFTEAQ
ncbi:MULTISPECIES: GNAT family N-acetyltransferase [unclassified Duganella]|uniref:GNAT family N-acetyltransferase n=1 Tax=unclassified Duganella TaxID=2636909 RepID=UPI000E350D6D|nr:MULTISPECIES: GNAT family N-acetyltransferase [unclassified Duganella]RFP10615.1 GNAT family N-acetyltransferase [Duganella sp. BJB475]RFP27357.1 GNAT family N-acetyltransferase [Duganella sp. BJB476]